MLGARGVVRCGSWGRVEMRSITNGSRAADPCIPWCCCGNAPDKGTLSLVHLRLTARFPFVWLHRGRRARPQWWSCLAFLRPEPTDLRGHYLCPSCLPLAGAVLMSARLPSVPPDAPALSSPVEPSLSASARAPTLPAYSIERVDGGDSLTQHILALRQLFRLEGVLKGVTGEGHRAIELTRGSAVVRCCACGRSVARLADLACSDEACAEPLYEFTLEGLRSCPARDGTRSVME